MSLCVGVIKNVNIHAFVNLVAVFGEIRLCNLVASGDILPLLNNISIAFVHPLV